MSQIENLADALTGVTRGFDFFRKKIRVALAVGVTPKQIVNQLDGADDQIAREMMRRIITAEIEAQQTRREIETGETINLEAITDTTIIEKVGKKMIIRDDRGEILVDSRVSGVIVTQNGTEWWLTDEGDRLSIELMDSGAYREVSITAPAERTVTLKPELSRARVLIPKPRRRVPL